MKILITGITGLVGSFVAKKMLTEGHEIFGLVRENADLSLITDILPKIIIEKGDILDIPNLEKAVEGKNWVIHCAGLVSFSPKDRENLFKVNTEGTANVVNICLDKQIKKLLFVSSVAALGRNTKAPKIAPQIITEKLDWVEVEANSNYAKSKYLAELEVWRGIAEGLNAVIVNPSNILGEADWQKTSTKLFKYVYDQNLFYTEGSLNFIDVIDLAEIISTLLNSNINAERFIVSAGAMPQIDFFRKIAQNFNKIAPKYKLKASAIEILWRLEAIKAKLLGNDPLITRETAASAKTSFIYENTKLKNAINFEFRSLEFTLERICNSLIEKYKKQT